MTKLPGGALLRSISIDRAAPTPVGAQLARSIREMMVAAVLRPGDRLPSSRTLAADLGLSRNTVVDVYDQLTAEGLIVSRVGDGAYVSAALNAAPRAPAPPTPQVPARLARLAEEAGERYFPRILHPPTPRPFVTGTPAYDAFPMALWNRLAARPLRSPGAAMMRYPDAAGLPALREAIAGHLRMNRGIACVADEVFVFNGAQDALTRLAALLVDPGDRVWFENPGHIGARNAFVAAGARLAAIPVDADGLDVAAGVAAHPSFRLAFVSPSHQQPLTVTMSLERRLALLAACARADAWIVEDDAAGDLGFAGRTPPPLRSIDRSGRVIHLGSFAKSLFPALCLGFVLAPPGLAATLERVAGAVFPRSPTPAQATLAAFIAEGHFAAHIRRMRRLYAERHDTLADLAARRLGGAMTLTPARGGLHVHAALAPDIAEEPLAAAAALRGVTVAPVSRYAIAPLDAPSLALGFAPVGPREAAQGVEALAAAVAAVTRR